MHALPVVLAFIDKYPLLSPHITFSNRIVDPVEEGIDVVVQVGGPDVWPPAVGHYYLGTGRHIFRGGLWNRAVADVVDSESA
nr:hypothetical protein [Pseudomonas sp. PB120]